MVYHTATEPDSAPTSATDTNASGWVASPNWAADAYRWQIDGRTELVDDQRRVDGQSHANR